MGPTEATIWSGVLSMLGGGAGALGAYCAARRTIKKDEETRTQNIRRDDFKEKLSVLARMSNCVDDVDKKSKEIISSIEVDIGKRNTVVSNKEVILQNLKFIKDGIDIIQKLSFELKVISKILDKEEDIKKLNKQTESYIIILNTFTGMYNDVENNLIRGESQNTTLGINNAYNELIKNYKKTIDELINITLLEIRK